MGSKGVVASTAVMVLLQEAHPRLDRVRPRAAATHAGGDRRAGDPADHGPALFHADGHRARLRAHDVHVILPGNVHRRSSRTCVTACPSGATSSGGRGNDGRGDGCVVSARARASTPTSTSACPRSGERPVAPVYIDGEKGPTLKGERIARSSRSSSSSTSSATTRGAAVMTVLRNRKCQPMPAGTPHLDPTEATTRR